MKIHKNENTYYSYNINNSKSMKLTSQSLKEPQISEKLILITLSINVQKNIVTVNTTECK